MRTGFRKKISLSFIVLVVGIFILQAQDPLYPTLPKGSKAPAFSGIDEHGNAFTLTGVKSKFVLLYFYEVHCHLCEAVTPELKKLYDSYHPLGLEVVAIPLSSDSLDWRSYIQDQVLNWINIFPGKMSQELLKSAYLVTVSPTIYLLDRKKVLLSERMGRAEQVETELNQRIR